MMTFQELKTASMEIAASLASKYVAEPLDPKIRPGDRIVYLIYAKGSYKPQPGFYGGDVNKPVDETPTPIDGFYAAHQPTYHWCWTLNPEKAHQYKSKKGAMKRAQDAVNLYDVEVVVKPVVIPRIEF